MIAAHNVLRLRLLLPIAAILALVLLAACGSSATEVSEPTATAMPQATVVPAQTTAAATSAPTAAVAATEAPPAMTTAQPEGELILGLTGYGNEVPIPWQEIAFGKNYGRFIWDYVVGTTDDAQLSTDTGLAESWEMSEDGLTWNFKLRQGIPFHNGEEFIAEDMKFALDQTMTIPESPASYKNQLLGSVSV